MKLNFNFGKKRQIPEDANCMVIDNMTRKRRFSTITADKIPSDSFEKDYYGKRLHLLGLTRDGNYYTIRPRKNEEGKTPTDLWVALHCALEVQDVYGLSSPLTEKIKLGVFVAIIIVIVSLTFLIVAQFIGQPGV